MGLVGLCCCPMTGPTVLAFGLTEHQSWDQPLKNDTDPVGKDRGASSGGVVDVTQDSLQQWEERAVLTHSPLQGPLVSVSCCPPAAM